MSLRVRYCHRLRDACLQGIQEREKKVLLDFYMVLLNFSRVLLDFSVVFTPSSHSFTPFFHGLPNFQMVSLDFPLFFHGFTRLLHNFTLPFQSPQMHLGGRTRGESIPHRHSIATWYMTIKKFQFTRLPLHLIP